jgi:hypothetical protein
MRHPPALALLGFAALVPCAAEAHSLLDVAAIADVAYGGSIDNALGHDLRVSPELGLRVDLLWYLGAEMTVKPIDFATAGAPGVDARFKASALLYLITMEKFDFYVKGGVGSMDATHLFSFSASDASLHAGVGIDVRITDSIAVAVEGLAVQEGLRRIFDSAAVLAASGDDNAAMHAAMPKTFLTKVGVRYYAF